MSVFHLPKYPYFGFRTILLILQDCKLYYISSSYKHSFQKLENNFPCQYICSCLHHKRFRYLTHAQNLWSRFRLHLLLLLSIREVFEYKIGCNQLVNNICFICLEDDSLNNCWVKPITSVWNEALGWKLYHFYIVIFSELYNFVSQILLLWRERNFCRTISL